MPASSQTRIASTISMSLWISSFNDGDDDVGMQRHEDDDDDGGMQRNTMHNGQFCFQDLMTKIELLQREKHLRRFPDEWE